MFTFKLKYFLLTVLLFVIEVLIALCVHDNFIRPYFGDYLVVMLVYCCMKTFIKTSTPTLCIITLVFAYAVETAQYFRLVDRLGLSGNKLARTVIGYGFEWWDILAYTLGVATILIIEYFVSKKKHEY